MLVVRDAELRDRWRLAWRRFDAAVGELSAATNGEWHADPARADAAWREYHAAHMQLRAGYRERYPGIPGFSS